MAPLWHEDKKLQWFVEALEHLPGVNSPAVSCTYRKQSNRVHRYESANAPIFDIKGRICPSVGGTEQRRW